MHHRGTAGAVLTNCRFVHNSAAYAGGMCTRGPFHPNPILLNCTFSGNVSAGSAGGMSNNGHSSDPMLVNCTFAGNKAGRGGGAMANDCATPVLMNCIIWGNTGYGKNVEESQIPGETLTVNYCCIQGWSGKLGGVGNFGDDPLFIDPDGPDNRIGTEDDNLRLKPGSPCINVGDNASIPADTYDLDDDGDPNEPIPFDLESRPRILNGTVDLGAYESG